MRTLTQVAFGLAVLATALPWSRFGPGSDAFGAWTRSGRWSLVAALAAIVGLVLSIASGRSRIRGSRWDLVLATLGGVVVIASLLSILFPPAFSRPWLGPWVGVASGALASASSLVAGRAFEKTTTADI